MKELVRFRIGSYGVQVFNAGKWIPADSKILDNIRDILLGIARA